MKILPILMSIIIFLSSSINIHAENVDTNNLDNQKNSDLKPKIDVNYLGFKSLFF